MTFSVSQRFASVSGETPRIFASDSTCSYHSGSRVTRRLRRARTSNWTSRTELESPRLRESQNSPTPSGVSALETEVFLFFGMSN
jgi:hypothetical protein